MPVGAGEITDSNERDRRRLSLRRDPLPGLLAGLRHHALPLSNLLAHERRAFVTWAGFDADKFTITQGQPANYKSSTGVLRTFCAECGTALTYQRTDVPGSIDVTLGSMDNPQILEPQDHTWTESRISWIRLNDGLPEYPRERKLLPSS